MMPGLERSSAFREAKVRKNPPKIMKARETQMKERKEEEEKIRGKKRRGERGKKEKELAYQVPTGPDLSPVNSFFVHTSDRHASIPHIPCLLVGSVAKSP